MNALSPCARWSARTGHRLILVAALAAVALIAASCGNTDEDAGPPATLSESVETSNSTTADPTTSSTTAVVESTSTTISPEEEVLEAHRYFMTEYFDRDESTLTIEERNSRIAAIAIDPLLARTLQRTAERAAEGKYGISPGYDSNVVEVQVDGGRAFVLDCSLDRGVGYGADGQVLTPADEEHRLRRTVFVQSGDGWFVSDFFTGGAACTPGA